MKIFRFNKIKWDKILSAALVIVLLVGCVAGLAAIFNTKTTEVSDFNFKKGALDSKGFYLKSDTSIYTKDLIECQGLVIEPDFEATGSYQVFYYDVNKNFVEATPKFDAHTNGIYERDNAVPSAKYCRIVISPDTPKDDDGYPVDDWKIYFWDVAGYADDYKITVNKKQTSFVIPYQGSNKLSYRTNATCGISSGVNGFALSDMGAGAGLNVSELVSTDGYYNICIVAEADKIDDVTINFLSENSLLSDPKLSGLDGDIVRHNGMVYITIDVPVNCKGIVIYSPLDVSLSQFGIYVW